MSPARLLRSGGSFAIVLVAYWLYAFLVVPWIEPPADPQQDAQITEDQQRSAELAQQAKIRELAPLFPPGSPILVEPKIVEYNQVRVLYSKLSSTEKARHHTLTPCTFVFIPEEPANNPAERVRRAVILEAPEGAELEFGESFNLLQSKLGPPLSGRLRGPVTIRSAGNDPGPEDDLLVVTRDVHLTNDQIWTSDTVEFTWGRSRGHGSNLTVNLQHANSTAGSGDHGAKITGIESVKLTHLDSLHLEPSPRPGAGNAVPGMPLGRDEEPLVLDVSFRGPLDFDVVKREAKLRQQVEIVQQHRNGVKDRLSCEELVITFAYRRKATAAEANNAALPTAEAASLSDLQPWQIQALGNPVDIQAPFREVQGRCNQLTYNLHTRQIYLEGAPEAFIQQGLREVHARTLEYQPANDPRLSVMWARGAGLVRAVDRAEGRPDRVLTASWTNFLKLAPDPQQQPCLTMEGDAKVESPGFGRLQAGIINLWLLMTPAAAGQPLQVRPDRMKAYPQVTLDSPQVSGKVEELGIWFREYDAQQAALDRQKLSAVGLFPQIQSRLEQAQLATQLARGFTGPQQAQRPVLESPPGGPAAAPSALSANNHFDVTAQLLHTEVFLQGQQPVPSAMTAQGNVHIKQTASQQPEEQPVLIEGDQIELRDAAQPYATVSIVGQRAHFEGQGMGLTGSNINLNRGQNRLWIDGPGEMTAALKKDLNGRPLAKAGMAVVQWQQGMNFNGQLATFLGNVVGRTQQLQFQTEQLDVGFDRFVHFAEMRGQPKPNPITFTCHREVVVQDHTPDDVGRPTRTDMVVQDLRVNLATGEIRSEGPGWMSSTRHGSNTMLVPDNLPARAPATTPQDENQLNYLKVGFQQGIRGNLNERRVTFHQQIRAIYGPVPSFEAQLDPDDPNGPKPGNTLVEADELSVVQMAQPNDLRQTSIELGTRGNTIVQGATLKGETFTARADQLNFAQAKNVLTLLGGGPLEYAQLFYQQSPGAVPVRHEAQVISICPKPWDVKTVGPRVTSGEFPALGRRGG